MLNNASTPKYYGEFRDSVLRGEIPVNREISMEMNRIDALIADPRVYYDPDAVEGFIAFCENEMTTTDGSDLYLLPSFKLWAEQIFGWWYFVDESVWIPDGSNTSKGHWENQKIKYRFINKLYLIVGRGAAKTLFASLIHSYFLNVDTSTTEQIVVAPTVKQSEETLSAIKTAIVRSRGPLFKFLTEGSINNTTGSKVNRCKLASTKAGIQNFLTNSIITTVPLSIDRLQGQRCKIASLDEWLSCDIREDPISAIEQSSSKIKDYLILATSSEGTIRNSIGDSMKMELLDILKGKYVNPHVSIWYYRLDDISEIAYPSMWVKANPNIGKTVTYETYKLDVERAEHAPAARNDILAKRFNIPMEGSAYFFTYEETKPHSKRDYFGMPCSLGCDLSRGDDFCAFTFLFPLPDSSFGIKARSYISSLTYSKLHSSLKQKYMSFVKEGSLVVIEGTVLNMIDIYDDIDRHIRHMQYDVRSIGYDPYNAREFIERWCTENGPFGVEKVIQGSKTESVPLGELKAFAEQKMLIFDESLMSYTMGNSIVIEDTNGNRKLHKKRNEQKIDNVAAMMDAYIAYKLNKGMYI